MPAKRSTSTPPKPKPYTRPLQPKTYIDVSDDEPDNDMVPILSSPSTAHDGSSDYNPDLETPTKVNRSNGKNRMYMFDDDEDDEMGSDVSYDEIKPVLSDDDGSYPGIVGDEYGDAYDEDEESGKHSKGKGTGKVKGKGKGKGKAKTATNTTPTKAKTGNGSSVGGSGKKPPIGWTGDENLKLFDQMHPKVTPNWGNVAAHVGRDSKVSCQNQTLVDQSVMSKQICSHGEEASSYGQGDVREVKPRREWCRWIGEEVTMIRVRG